MENRMENVKVEYSSFYLEAVKEIKAAEKALVARKFQEAYEHCLNAQTEMRLLGGAVKTWIPTKED